MGGNRPGKEQDRVASTARGKMRPGPGAGSDDKNIGTRGHPRKRCPSQVPKEARRKSRDEERCGVVASEDRDPDQGKNRKIRNNCRPGKNDLQEITCKERKPKDSHYGFPPEITLIL